MPGRKPMGLRRRLTVSICVLTSVLLAAACGTALFFASGPVREAEISRIAAQVDLTVSKLEEQLAEDVRRMEAFAEELGGRGVSPGEALEACKEEGLIPPGLLDIKAYPGTGADVLDSEGSAAEQYPGDYLSVIRTSGVVFGEIGSSGGMPVIEAAVAVRQEEGEAAGVLAASIPLEPYQKLAGALSPLADGYAFLYSGDGESLLRPNAAGLRPAADKGASAKEPKAAALASQLTGRGGPAEAVDESGVRRVAVYQKLEAAGWTAGFAAAKDALLDPLRPTAWICLAIWAAGTACAAGFTALLLGIMLDPVREMTRAAQEIARGGYNIQVDYQPDDEFGALCRAMEAACGETARYVEEIGHVLGRMARGDFTAKIEDPFEGAFVPVRESVNSIADALHQVFTQISEMSKQSLGGSYEVSGISGRLSSGITSQKHSVEELGKAVTLLRHESNQNAMNAGHAEEAALSTTASLRECSRQSVLLRDSMTAMLKLADDLDGELQMLNRFSIQCSRWAVNGTAKALKLGKDGEGLIVAMEQLRAISLRAEQAAERAVKQISRLREGLGVVDGYAGDTAQAMGRASKQSGQTAEYLGRVISTTQLQSQAAAKMSKEVSIISTVVQSNEQMAQQCGVSGTALSEQAQALARMASAFYTKGDGGEKSPPIIMDAQKGDFSVS